MKRRWILLLALAAVFCLGCLTVASAEIETGTATGTAGGSDNITYSFDTDTGIMTLSGQGGWSDIHWFYKWKYYGDERIRKIVISDGITSIAAHSFTNCKNLTSISIPTSVTRIGVSAFQGCVSLRSVELPASDLKIEGSAFAGCTVLSQINIPATTLYIGDSAFNGDSALRGEFVSYGDLGSYVFQGCSFTKLEIRNCYQMGQGAIQECPNLKTVVLCEGITSIPMDFAAYDKMLTTINIPSTVTSIVDHAFAYCEGLRSISLPEGLISIKIEAFGKTGLTSIELPSTLMTLDSGVFMFCYNLRSASIPGSCEKIPNNLFKGDKALKEVTIGEGIYQIGDYSFADCEILPALTLPQSLETIGKSAFENCKKLAQCEIPPRVEVIGESAFSYCEALTDVNIPEAMIKIEPYTFRDAGLKNVQLPVSILTIGEYAFYGNPIVRVTYAGTRDQWNEINIENGNDSLLDGMKVKVAKLTLNKTKASLWTGKTVALKVKKVTPEDAANKEVTWSSSDEKVARVDQNGLVTAVSPGNATITCTAADGSEATATCKITVYVDETKVSGLKYTLNHSKKTATVTGPVKNSITKAVIPAKIKANGLSYKVTAIEESAFSGLKKLASVEIGANIASIGQEAFRYCAKLKTITIKTIKLTAKNVGDNAFSDGYKKATYKCPASKLKAYKKILKKKGAPETAKFK